MRRHYPIFLIFCFILTAFTGATSLNPILPQFVMLHNHTVISNALLYGVLAALFPFGQFISAYLLPYLARHYGYHYIIQITSLLSLVTTLLMSLSLWYHQLLLLCIFRFLCGCLEANVVLTREMVLGLTTDRTAQKQWLGMISSGITLGFLAGPSINGFIYHFNPFISLFFPTIMALIMVTITFLLPVFPYIVNSEDKMDNSNSTVAISVKQIWFVSLTIYFAADLFYQYIPYFLAVQFNFNVQKIALNLFLIAFANALIAPFAHLPTRYIGYRLLFLGSSLLFMINLALLSMANQLLSAILLFTNGALIALLSNNVIFYFTDTLQNKNSFMMSHIVSARVLVSGASALFAGQIAALNLKFPFYLSIVCIILFLSSLRYQWKI